MDEGLQNATLLAKELLEVDGSWNRKSPPISLGRKVLLVGCHSSVDDPTAIGIGTA